MPVYLRPGVYLEEVAADRGPRPPIRQRPPSSTGALSSRVRARWFPEHTYVAFVGLAEQGPLNTPVWVHSVGQFFVEFGYLDGGVLAHAVSGFFANGGRSCVVIRVGEDDPIVDVVGDTAGRNGVAALEALHDVSLVCVPDLMNLYSQGRIDMDGVRAVQLALIAHCEMLGDRFAILDCPPGLDAQQLREWRMSTTGYDSSFAAVYYPWVRVYDDYRGRFRYVPPSGHIAGVYARTDQLRGFHHTPANQQVKSVAGLELDVTGGEQDALNPVGLNALVHSVDRDVVVWGGRTLSSDPAWRYIHRRRLVNFIRRNVSSQTNWVIFQRPDDPAVRSRLVAEVAEFMSLLWFSGAISGDTPEDAFWLEFDDSPELLDAGMLPLDCSVTLERNIAYNFRLMYFCDQPG